MATSRITVYFRPRPHHPQFGTHWMPAGGTLPYGPFHELQGPIPTDVTEEIDIACSAELWRYWREFHTEILPLLRIDPPSLHTVPLRTHWHMIFAEDYQHRKATIERFLARIEEMMLIFYPAASSEQAKDNKGLLCQMATTDFPDMDGPTIQRKMWICILCELQEYQRSWKAYKHELRRRTTDWEQFCAAATFVYSDLKSRVLQWQNPQPLSVDSHSHSPSSTSMTASNSTSSSSSNGSSVFAPLSPDLPCVDTEITVAGDNEVHHPYNRAVVRRKRPTGLTHIDDV
ncbi:hypothetical protein B0H11DRAFT_1147623 [Mycena galericulata]|nr:hypothetical protein B0H11DRAFT_1147623 [Mycena galericulata]